MMNERLARIKLLAMDVDGTLTDGSMIFYGDEQVKSFNVMDGLGIRLAMNYGLKVAWITGNITKSVEVRAHSLGVADLRQGSRYKSDALRDLAGQYGLKPEEIGYIGDDLNDLPAFDYAGVSFAVNNAVREVKSRADIVTEHSGGRGAVREVIEMILVAKGQWEEAVESFLEELKSEEAGKPGPEAVA